jgi:two-component system cell cycle response regulator DivK
MTESHKPQATVMVVEDYEDHLYMTRIFLEQCGSRVVEAQDGEEAVSFALSERPDLILMDIGLPKIDGYEATRRIRSHAEMRDVPIIAYTSHYQYALAAKATEAGFNEYLAKPMDFDEMKELINRLLPQYVKKLEE